MGKSIISIYQIGFIYDDPGSVFAAVYFYNNIFLPKKSDILSDGSVCKLYLLKEKFL